MDLLGKRGEEAREEVEEVSRKIQQMESHLNGLDSALHDFMNSSEKFLEDEKTFQEHELEKLDRITQSNRRESQEIKDLKQKIRKLENNQRSLKMKIEEIYSSGLVDIVSEASRTVRETTRISKQLASRMNELEEKFDNIENEFLLEVNSRDYDFEQKADRKELEKTEEDLMEEIKKLRASVNVLAEEVDSKESLED